MKSLKNVAGFGAEDAPFVSGVVVCCRCHWESRPQEGGSGIAQAWATWPEGCFGTKWYSGVLGARSTRDGVPEMTPAMRTTAVLLGFLTFLNLKICHVKFCHDKRLGK